VRKFVFALFAIVAMITPGCGESPTSPSSVDEPPVSGGVQSHPILVARINRFQLSPYNVKNAYVGVGGNLSKLPVTSGVFSVKVYLPDNTDRRLALIVKRVEGNVTHPLIDSLVEFNMNKTTTVEVPFKDLDPNLVYQVTISNRDPILVDGDLVEVYFQR